jgi:cell division protein FtsQ
LAKATARRRVAARIEIVGRVGLALLVLGIAVVVAYLASIAAADPRLALGEVNVTGAVRAGSDAVLTAAALPRGTNVWLLDTAAAQRRVEALPWVSSARVERSWPNQVAISVVERAPVARLALALGGYALLDGAGRVLEIGTSDRADAKLPLLRVRPAPVDIAAGALESEQAASDALAAAQRLQRLGVRITEVQSEPATGISVTTSARLRVLFGDMTDLERKVALFNAITQRIAHPDEVAYVDVRSPSAPTVQYR